MSTSFENSCFLSDGLREEEGEEVVTDGGGGRNRSTTIAIVLMPCDAFLYFRL
jgi:hypothetical protein